jgi:hypothetical protein
MRDLLDTRARMLRRPSHFLLRASYTLCSLAHDGRGRPKMRTLLDLLNNERAYVRIYVDPAGFGYEKATYAPRPIGDLFDRMNGYPSIDSAREAAQLQLLVLRSNKRRRGYTTGRRARAGFEPVAIQLI